MPFTSRCSILHALAIGVALSAGCAKKKPEPAAASDAKPKAEDHAAHGEHKDAGHGDHKHPAGAEHATLSKLAPNAKVFFANLKPGQKVQGTMHEGKLVIDIQMGAENVKIQPAGKQEDYTGHHHIVIDGAAVPTGKAVPADDKHIHFGQGQTKTKLPISPGKHKLTLQLADGFHLSYGPKVSADIEIEVLPAAK